MDTGVTPAKDIEAAVTRDTRLVAVTHASNVNGVVQPVEEYAEVARRHNLLLLVDAAQTAGKYPIDADSAGIDLLAFSGHKGLFGPPGVGLLYIGPRAELNCLCEGGTGSYSELEEQPAVFPDKFEVGTANSVGISGLGAGLDFVFSEGVEKIRAHGLSLADRLIEGLSRIRGVALCGVFKKAARVPIVSFVVAGYDPGEAGAILDQFFDIKARTGLHCAPAAHRSLGTFPSGTIRLSPGYFNTLEEIEFTLKAVEKIAASRR
jgi:selenocysteine lyase/cysteine desulfurase